MGELSRAELDAARRGDRLAVRALVRAYQARVYRFACRAAGVDVAEDVTQEAFVRVFRALPGFDPEGPAPLSRWVLGIAARTAIDAVRRRQSQRARIEAMPDPPAPEAPESATARKQIGAMVARAVEALGPDVRATFVLRAYHELTMPEIAEALDVELGTVKSRLSRARETLREALGDLWDDYRKGVANVAAYR